MSVAPKDFGKAPPARRESGQLRAQTLADGVMDFSLRRILQSDAGFELYSSIDSELFLTLGTQRPASFIIASARAQEGRTTIAALYAGLAAAYSDRSKVLLLDSDVRSNDLLRRFEAGVNRPGLHEYMRGEAELANCLWVSPLGNLTVMGGCGESDPRNKLDYKGFKECIADFGRRYDLIVVDTRPASDNPDLRSVARTVGSALVVVEYGVTYRQQGRRMVDSLLEVETRVLGVVLNKRKYPVPRIFYGR